MNTAGPAAPLAAPKTRRESLDWFVATRGSVYLDAVVRVVTVAALSMFLITAISL